MDEDTSLETPQDAVAEATNAAALHTRRSVVHSSVPPGAPLSQPAMPSGGDEANPYAQFAADPSDNGVALMERQRLNRQEAFYRGSIAGSARLALMANLATTPDDPGTDPARKKANDGLRDEYRRVVSDLGAYDLMKPWGTTLEAATALSGQLEGSLVSPESWLGWGAKGATFAIRTAKAALQQGAIQAATDPIVQGLDIAGKVQDKFDPVRTALAAGLGSLIGAGGHAVGEGLGKVIGQGMVRRQLRELADEDPAFLGVVPQEEAKPPVVNVDQHQGETVIDVNGQRTVIRDGEVVEEPASKRGKPSEGSATETEAAAIATQEEPRLTDFLSERFGPKWEVRNRITAKTREDVENPISRKDYEAAVREWVQNYPETAKAYGAGVYERYKPADSEGEAALIAEGDESALATRRGGGQLAMQRQRPTAGTPAPGSPPTGTAVATVPGAPSPAQAVHLRSLQQQVTDLAEALDIPIREGRIKLGKNVLGIYNSGTGVVRVREIADLEVVAHEAGHAIEKKAGQELTNLTNTHGTELAPLVSNPAAYAPAVHVKEGFAEWIRRYIGNPAHAKQIAPNFASAFDRFMRDNHPDILDTINRAADAYNAYIQAPSTDAVGAVRRSAEENLHGFAKLRERLREEGFPAVIKSVMQHAYDMVLDDKAPISRAVRDLATSIRDATGNPLDLKGADNPDVLFRLLGRARQAAVRDMMDGVRPYRSITPEGPSLSQAITEAIGAPSVWGKWEADKKAGFSHYLIARRAEYLWRKFQAGDIPNPPAAFSAADAMVAMAEFERANPNFRRASDLVHEYSRQLLRKQFESGLLDADVYGKLLQEEFYVPFMRDMSDKPLADKGGPGGASAEGPGTVSLVKKLKGSTRDIKDPIESLMMQTFMANRTIRHNDVIRAFVDLAKKAGIEGGKYVEPIPAHEAKRYTVDITPILEAKARAAGMTPNDAKALASAMGNMIGEDPIIGSYFKMEQTSPKGEPIVFYKEGGQLKAARFMAEPEGHALYETLTAAPEPVTDMWVQLIGTAASLKRSGIITNPTFALTNYIRDQVAASILRSDYIPFVGGVKGISDEFRQGQNAVLYGYAGGVAGGAAVGPVERAAEAEVNALAKKGYAVQRLTSFKGLLELASFTEAGTRNSIFGTMFEAKRRQGLSDYEAMVEAAFQAEDILDFSRHGSRTMVIRNLLPFVNAHMQGLDKARRTMIEPITNRIRDGQVFTKDSAEFKNAVAAWLKAGALGGGLGAVWAAVNWEKEAYRDANPYFKGTHFVVPFGDKLLVVPKPFELSIGFTAGEYAFHRLMQDDPRAGGQFIEAAWQSLQPPNPITDIPLVSTATELYLGKSLFTGKDIVPGQMQRLPAPMQFNDRTSGLAKWLGQITGLSPMKIEYGIGSEFGNWGRDVMALSQGVDQDAPALNWDDHIFTRRFIKDPTRSSDITTKFWDFMGQTTGKYNQDAVAYDALVKGFQDEKAKEFLSKLPSGERAFVTLKSAAREDNGKPAFNADEKRLHPLQRAYDAVSLLNGLRRELSNNTFAGFESQARLKLDPEKRRDLIANVRELAQMEMRNALVIMKEPGYANRPLLDPNDTMAKIVAQSADVGAEIATRYATAKIYTTNAVVKAWPKLRDEVIKAGSEADVRGLAFDAKGDGWEFGGDKTKKPPKRRLPVARETVH